MLDWFPTALPAASLKLSTTHPPLFLSQTLIELVEGVADEGDSGYPHCDAASQEAGIVLEAIMLPVFVIQDIWRHFTA